MKDKRVLAATSPALNPLLRRIGGTLQRFDDGLKIALKRVTCDTRISEVRQHLKQATKQYRFSPGQVTSEQLITTSILRTSILPDFPSTPFWKKNSKKRHEGKYFLQFSHKIKESIIQQSSYFRVPPIAATDPDNHSRLNNRPFLLFFASINSKVASDRYSSVNLK